MTAGRGWIALALVVFASWLPGRLAIGAYLFGAVTILQLHAQGAGLGIPSQLLSSLPYLATIIVLVLISRARAHCRIDRAGVAWVWCSCRIDKGPCERADGQRAVRTSDPPV